MKLKNTIGNRRIVALVADLDGVILDHDAVAVKHGITIYNFKYLLRKMTDLGIIEITRTRDSKGTLNASFCTVLEVPEIEKQE